jgi:hypothetical protein
MPSSVIRPLPPTAAPPADLNWLPLELFAHTQPCYCRAGRGALRAVGGAGRAHKRDQKFIVRAANRVRSSNGADGRRRAGVALGAGGPDRTGRPSGTLRSGLAALAARTGWSLRARFTLRSLRPDRPLRTQGTGFTAFTCTPLRANGPLRSLCALRSSRTDRAGLAGGTWRPLWPSSGVTASHEREHS